MQPETAICSVCHDPKLLTSFEMAKVGRRTQCNQCRHLQKKKANPDRVKNEGRKAHGKIAARRRLYPDWAIYVDCKASDRKRGLVNDLDREVIRCLIAKGCQYCGETRLRMTLDRKDNSLGHVQANVMPACLRCNYMRGSMPYAAWELIVPVLHSIREQGHFEDWQSVPLNLQYAEDQSMETPSDPKQHNGTAMVKITCLECGQQAVKVAGYVKANAQKGHKGPFCGRSCAAKYSSRK